jgi:hypothetical protein
VSRETDISQIKKYLNGELDARAMHELEKRALDDPFLMEAMQGYENTGNDQQASVDDLAQRLQQRTTKKEARVIPWKTWLSIAAILLLVSGVGIRLFEGRQAPAEKIVSQPLADNIKVEKKVQDTAKPTTATVQVTPVASGSAMTKTAAPKPKSSGSTIAYAAAPPIQSEKEANAPVLSQPATMTSPAPADEVYKPRKDSVEANEVVVNAERKQKRAAVAAVNTKQPTETLLKSKADGVMVTDNIGQQATHLKTVSGIVIGRGDGQPITGATVKVIGRPFGVVTDAKGKFTLSDVSGDQTLAVNYIGYNGKKVKVSNKDSLNISLDPNNSALAEVIVVKKQDNDAASGDAHPNGGLDDYNKNLDKNAISPDGKTGKVRLSFMVAADGSLSQFKILKSLSDAADKKAIDLVMNGEKWVGGADKKPKEIKVSIRFH